MKKILKLTVFPIAFFLLVLSLWHDTRPAHAQTINVPFSYSVGTATHTSCPAVVASTTQYCFPADGPWVSINGATWQAIPLAAAVAGVTSFNGRTGAVFPLPSDYPNAVASVNGKTGVVVLGATTTVQ
jgi:hypothetical protein